MQFNLKNVRTGQETSFSAVKILEAIGDQINDRIDIGGEHYYLSSYAQQSGDSIDLSPVFGRIGALENAVSTTSTTINTLSDGYVKLQTDVKTIKDTDIKTISGKITTLETQSTTFDQSIKNFTTDHTKLQADVKTIKDTDIKTISGKITTLEGQTTTLQQNVASISAIDNRLATVENTTVNLVRSVNDVKATSDNLSKSITSLNPPAQQAETLKK